MRWPRMSRTVLALLLGCTGGDDSNPPDSSAGDTAELTHLTGELAVESVAAVGLQGEVMPTGLFGAKLAVQGERLVVLAEGEGAAYVFQGSDRLARLEEGTDAPRGDSLCAGPDLDGDGGDDLVVADRDVHSAGLAWVLPLDAPDGTLYDEGTATVASSTRDDELGAALACGAGQLVVGVRGADGAAGDDVGAAWVYAAPLSGDLVRADAAAIVEGEAAGDYAGRAVALGDLDGDGIDELVVGAYRNSQAARFAGAAYVIDVATGTLADATTKVYGETEGEALGRTVTVAPDLDGDGLVDLVVGASGWSELRGALYAFGTLSPGAIPASAALAVLEGEDPEDSAGVGLAAGDLDADGVVDLAVGAPGERENPEADAPPGWVGVLYGPARGRHAAADLPLRLVASTGGDALGVALAVATGDDGLPVLAASAYRVPVGGTDDAGRVYLVPLGLP